MEEEKRKKIVPFREKKEVIEDLENGFVTEESILEKYKIIPKTLRDWKKQVQQPTQLKLEQIDESTIISLKQLINKENLDLNKQVVADDWLIQILNKS